MIEIIPNWHPIFVHFTVGLFSTSVGFYILAYLAPHMKFVGAQTIAEFEIVSRWCLWLAGLVVIPTVLAGLYAYYTVGHDTPSHVAMTNHRNWALPTAVAIVLASLWSMWGYYRHKTFTLTFVFVLLLIQGMLLSTAWHGAELVYRYGLGVISLPQSSETGHHHNASRESASDHSNMPFTESHGHEE
jgi:uncharacterized membrane protein